MSFRAKAINKLTYLGYRLIVLKIYAYRPTNVRNGLWKCSFSTYETFFLLWKKGWKGEAFRIFRSMLIFPTTEFLFIIKHLKQKIPYDWNYTTNAFLMQISKYGKYRGNLEKLNTYAHPNMKVFFTCKGVKKRGTTLNYLSFLKKSLWFLCWWHWAMSRIFLCWSE